MQKHTRILYLFVLIYTLFVVLFVEGFLIRGDPKTESIKVKIIPFSGDIHRRSKGISTKKLTESTSGTSLENKITVLTQLTFERLPRLVALSKRWPHEISAALYIRVKENFEKVSVENMLENIFKVHPELLQERIKLHLVLGEKQSKVLPLNMLRNVAWKNSKTEYVLTLDVDFVPSENIQAVLKKHEKLMEEKLQEKSVFILPTFHYKCKDEKEISTCVQDEPVFEDKPSQQPTNYTRWYAAQDVYQVQYKFLYEPYFIGSTNMTKFDETFDIGNDKLSQVYHLAVQKYKFYVLPHVYLGHMPHTQEAQWSLNSDKYHYNPFMSVVKFFMMIVKVWYQSGDSFRKGSMEFLDKL
jgi:hypothetical protein